MGEKNIGTFDWYGTKMSKTFPIDYTIQELATLLDPAKSSTASTKPLKEAIDNTGLRSALQSLQLSDSTASKNPSIPLEAAPFFACLVKLTKTDVYKKVFSRDSSNQVELQAQLVDELCLSLYNDTQNSSLTYAESSVLLHQLFQNERFLQALISKLWKDEITSRFDELQFFAKQRHLGSQLDIFVDCLTSLDRCILNLKTQTYSLLEEKRDSKELPELKHMLYQLLSSRTSDLPMGTDSKIRFYRVKNIPVGHQNMKEAFNQLKKPPLKPDLLNTARKCYLENIANDIKNDRGEQVQKALREEQLYAKTQEYLKITSSNISTPELQLIIKERCIYQCRLVIDYCVFDGNAKIPPQSLKQNYTATLLDRLIQDKINGKLDQFRETVQLVAFYSAASFGSWQQRQYCEVRLAEYLKQADSTPEMSISTVIDRPMDVQTAEDNPYYNEIRNFAIYFERAWSFLHNQNTEVEKIFHQEDHLFIEKERLANELFSIGTSAAIKFKKQELMFPTLDETCASLDCYDFFASDLKKIYPAYLYHLKAPTCNANGCSAQNCARGRGSFDD